MRRHPLLVWTTGLIALGSLAGAARAQPQPDIETREKQALAACDSRQVDKGIEALGSLWAETQNATYVYNQGRCYQKNSMAAEALNRFREFLRVVKDHPVEHPELIERAQAYVKELEADIASTSGPKGQQPEPASPPALTPIPVPEGQLSTGDQASETTPQAAPRDWRRISGYALGAVGVAGMTVGAILALTSANQASGAKDRFESAQTGQAWDKAQSDFNSDKGRNRLGWGLVGVGAAFVLGGVALVATAPARNASADVALTPWITPNSGGIGAKGSW